MIKIPRGNRTGPWGQGPRTGRGMGYCNGYSTPGYTKGPGIGWGRGYGGGRGWGRGGGWGRGRGPYPSAPMPVTPWPAEISPEDESKYLEETLNSLKQEIELIQKRLGELASQKTE